MDRIISLGILKTVQVMVIIEDKLTAEVNSMTTMDGIQEVAYKVVLDLQTTEDNLVAEVAGMTTMDGMQEVVHKEDTLEEMVDLEEDQVTPMIQITQTIPTEDLGVVMAMVAEVHLAEEMVVMATVAEVYLAEEMVVMATITDDHLVDEIEVMVTRITVLVVQMVDHHPMAV